MRERRAVSYVRAGGGHGNHIVGSIFGGGTEVSDEIMSTPTELSLRIADQVPAER